MQYEGLIIELEPDNLENGVKWAISNITKNKPSVIDEIATKPFEMLQLKHHLQFVNKYGKNSSS